jgi:arabinan endo-1,5-alpha-L-arabinosidase
MEDRPVDRFFTTRRQALLGGAGVLGAAALPFAVHAQGSINDRMSGDTWPVHDPCIIKADGLYHLFCTSQMHAGRGLIAWRTSPDLMAWTLKGDVMPAFPAWVTQALPDTKGAWAPDISHENGVYRLYYAASLFGKNTSVIGLMTTPTLDTARPDFGWRDEGLVIASRAGDDYNAIDPNLVKDADGRQWLVLGSFWTGLKMTELDPATGKPKDPKALISVAERPDAPDAIEASFLIRHGAFYYLFASDDFCCRGVNSTYYTVVGRSASVTGPFVDRDGKSMLQGGGTVVLHASPDDRWKGPGHCAILQDADADYIVYHAYDAQNNGRPTLRINRLDWRDGWPVAV